MTSLTEYLTAKNFPTDLPLDGKVHRFSLAGDKTGWFIGKQFTTKSGKPFVVARFGDWKADLKFEFRSEETTYNDDDQKEIQEKLTAASKKEAQEKAAHQAEVAETARRLWETYSTNGHLHGYLERKGVEGYFGSREGELPFSSGRSLTNALIVPGRDIDGNIWTLQGITETGDKYFLPGGRISGSHHLINPDRLGSGVLILCEGFATGASLAMAVPHAVASAFNAGNLEAVAISYRQRHPNLKIIICGDEDLFTVVDGIPKNTGRHYASRAASTSGATAVFPRFTDLSSKPTDFNDLHQLEGLDAVTAQVEAALGTGAGDPPPPNQDSATPGSGLNHKEALELFNQIHKYKLLGNSKICYIWTGTHYEDLGDQYIKNFAYKHLKGDKKGAREEFLDRVQITNLQKPSWFDDTTSRHINFKNGVLNIDTGNMTPHSPDRGFRYVLGYDFDPKATCPTYDAMMTAITCGDKELEMLLDEYMGYALSYDRYWIHKILVLTGEGENGKSTWMDVLRELAGAGNYTSLFMKDLGDDGKRQMLDGKLFNISAEVPKRAWADTALFKALASGEEITVRQIYKRPYAMKVRAKFIFACNALPDTDDTTRGFFRRFLIIPFNATFVKGKDGFDPHILEKLLQEKSGIFNRAFAGYKRLLANKSFTESRASMHAAEQYRLDNDSALRWITENLKVLPLDHGTGAETALSEVYGKYAMEMDEGNIRPLTNVDFGRRLSRIIPDYSARISKAKRDSKTVRVLKNVVFGTPAEF